jgi:hypothetical protein
MVISFHTKGRTSSPVLLSPPQWEPGSMICPNISVNTEKKKQHIFLIRVKFLSNVIVKVQDPRKKENAIT